MAKTTNHPPYEIDPWKADTTEPPSGLTFNPEIVESAGKPKQAPVPPEPTEGQLKIEESISRVDKFNNEMNTLREQQKKVLAEVEKNIDETNEKIKQLNDLEEQIKKQVGEYTEETDEKLRQAELLRGELRESKAKMEKAVNDASSAITAAENAQKALKAYQDGEAERFKEAINQAQVGVAKAADVNKQITALKNSLGGEIDKQISTNEAIKKIQSDNKGLSSKLDDALKASKQGVDDAAKAIELLNSNIDIGGSLIALVSGTTTPIWAEKLEKSTETTPDGEEVYVANDVGYKMATEKLVKASDKIEYLVTFWHKSSEPGSKMFLQLSTYNEEGNTKNAVIYRKDKKVAQDGSVSWSEKASGYVVDAVQGDTKWTKHEYVVGLKPGTEFVFFKGLWWNHTSVSVKANQYMGGFRIDPLIPSQAEVDRAQNKAIEANSKAIEANSTALKQQEAVNKLNSDFRESQTKLNKTYNAMWDAQGKRNLLQEGIDSAQTKAIKSLSKLDAGTSLVGYYEPTDEEVQKGNARYDLPEWGEYLTDKRYESSDGYPGLPPGEDFAHGVSSGTGTKSRYLSFRPVIPETTYTLSFWAKGSGDLVIYMYGDGQRSYPITSVRQLKINQDTMEEERDKNGKRIYDPDKNGNRLTAKGSQWLLGGFNFPEEWTYFSYEVTFLASTRNVRFSTFYWNWRNKSSKGQYISGMTFTPDIPSQAQIDQSQTEAIKANTLALENQKAINDKQEGIAAAHTKAIDSNRKAIRALAKIDLGGSLLAYMPLTDAEIQKGITREYVPAWAANATNVLDGSKLSGTTSAKGYVFLSGTGGSAKGEEVYAQVSQGTQYLLDIDLFTPTYMAFNIVFKTSNNKIKNPVKKFYWTEDDEYGGLKTTSYLTNTNKVTISTNGGRIPILVEFQDNVEDIYIEKLKWTRTNSVTVKSFSLAPYTPSQAAIDARQNKALEGLKLAQNLQRDMTKQQQDFTTKLYDMSAGVIHLLRDEVAGSITHEIGFVMPSTDRLFKIYARTSFRGNLTILVNYATGIGDGLKTHRVKDTNLVTMSNPRNISSSIIKKSIFEDMPYSYRFGEVKVDVGDVESIVVLIDHINWSQA